jgi:hypothetical protein
MKTLNLFAAAALAAGCLIAGAAAAHAQSASITATSPQLIMGFEVADDTTGTGANSDIELDLGYTAASLVAAANANGGTLVLGGTNFQTDLSANDLGATYGADWATRTSGGGKLDWSIFGANDNTDQFWVTSPTKFHLANSAQQAGFVDQVDFLYADLTGNTSTTHSNQDYIVTNASGDSTSYYNAITQNASTSNWGYAEFTGNTETTVGTTTAIPFYSAPVGSTSAYATQIGTFSLSNGGVLTFTATAVPEPSTWASIVLGAAGLIAYRRRRS